MQNINMEDLKNITQVVNEIRELAYKDKTLFFDKSIDDFITLMSLLPPQNYSKRFESRIINKLNLKHVSASDDKGDCVDKWGDHYEIKITLLNKIKRDCEFVQIRPWQKCGYLLFVFDMHTREHHCFKLSNNEIKHEMKNLNNVSNAHKVDSKNESFTELRFSLSYNSEDFNRFRAMYSSNCINLI